MIHLPCVIILIWLSFYHSVLVSDIDQLKVSDLGTSCVLSEKITSAGTVAWLAPEMIGEEPCSEEVDVRLVYFATI